MQSVDFQISNFLVNYLDYNKWQFQQETKKVDAGMKQFVSVKIVALWNWDSYYVLLVGSTVIRYMSFTGFLITNHSEWILIVYFEICKLTWFSYL